MQLNFWHHFTAVLPIVIKGAEFTIKVTAVAVLIGIIIGLTMSLMKLSGNRLLKLIANIYIEFFRGTPLLVQIFLWHYGVSSLITAFSGDKFHFQVITTAFVVLGINSGAYVAEIFRAGIQGVDIGQVEAARSLGMSKAQTLRHVVVPQAWKLVIPPLGNEFVMLLKDSSLLSTIGAMEIMKRGQIYIGMHATPFPAYVAVALCYLVITFTLTRFINGYERKLSSGGKNARSMTDIR
ncbi:MAG: amino acid ABC transporter permease [Clostridiales bacterium]|uniref:Amino acid ABC transporter membrane protein, PAAT family n=1 Tax=Peptococcus niger TaxID=2741 RepID=A0A1G6WQV3_PEPNI|nr:amino acid ABC transporter permease [Peptococcus niger]MBS5595277.1 amino acid ABC transporter permease [Clostridiales bacterium]MDU7505709.1 amino acid ABC transporter permease [Clostridia bacterium]MBS5916553.1 amino acid ABC transporter permease [Clostridiales bacterium]MDU1028550.1 amino acid ABC transporter permease [Clostridiales bacterium]MDU2292384.1 amino acid ABC transporter permease [Peptococcus niger]